MLRKILTENYEIDQAQFVQHIYRSLEELHQKMESELAHKQTIVDKYAHEIKTLQAQVGVKDQALSNLELQLADQQRSINGNRQLINKLLNDLERMQQNVEWYKRTYENRSLLGVIKDKLKHLIA